MIFTVLKQGHVFYMMTILSIFAIEAFVEQGFFLFLILPRL